MAEVGLIYKAKSYAIRYGKKNTMNEDTDLIDPVVWNQVIELFKRLPAANEDDEGPEIEPLV